MVIWNPAWETGIPLIDQQHRDLLGRFEGLLLAIHENHPEDRVPELLAFLAEYVERHFSTEETHMQDSRYPRFVEHREIHDDMRERVARLQAEVEADPKAGTEDVINFMTDWLVRHIDEEDRLMARHLHGFFEQDQKGLP